MILKTFREKSNKKFIDKLLSVRKTKVNSNKIKSIAVLLNTNEYKDFEAFKTYLETLNLSKFKIIAFTTNDKLELYKLESSYNPNDFGWRGKIKNTDLLNFCNESFDVLISYYKESLIQLNLITTLSKANFKVGLSNIDERLYDLIIDLDPSEIKVFEKEFKKYLKILNKL